MFKGVRAPLDLPEGGGGGGGDLIAWKKLYNARKHVLYKRTQIAVKTKRSHFVRLMNVLSAKITVESEIFEPQRETKIRSKNGIFRKIWGN